MWSRCHGLVVHFLAPEEDPPGPLTMCNGHAMFCWVLIWRMRALLPYVVWPFHRHTVNFRLLVSSRKHTQKKQSNLLYSGCIDIACIWLVSLHFCFSTMKQATWNRLYVLKRSKVLHASGTQQTPHQTKVTGHKQFHKRGHLWMYRWDIMTQLLGGAQHWSTYVAAVDRLTDYYDSHHCSILYCVLYLLCGQTSACATPNETFNHGHKTLLEIVCL